MRVVTAGQMRDADAAAVADRGDVALMHAAGAAIADAIVALAPDARSFVAFAGPGNNGGDAYAAFAALAPRIDERLDARVYAVPVGEKSPGRRDAERRAHDLGVRTLLFPGDAAEARAALVGADVALDAMLGTGARPALDAPMRGVVAALAASDALVLAIDVPTGIDATTGAVGEHAVRATATIALGALKIGQLLEPARSRGGELWLGSLDLDAELAAQCGPRYEALDDAGFLALLPQRAEAGDKRASGAPLVVAGSERFPGAGVLCSRGAARAGAGYVTLAAPRDARAALQAHLVEEMVATYDPSDVEGSVAALLDFANKTAAVAIGPGLATDDDMAAIVRGFLARLDRPFVADASALRICGGAHVDVLRGKRCVVTPHASEFVALDGGGALGDDERLERLRAFVSRTGIVTLLKGNTTLIDDGGTIHVNVTGTNALATAGTGDVLTGVIGTLLAQGLTPVDAARAGAYWHGLAGREAKRERPIGVVAGDVIDALGRALPARRPSRDAPRARRLS